MTSNRKTDRGGTHRMFSALRKRLRISPASVIASLALVFAMTGGAYAAGKYLITSTKQIKPSVLASLKGTAGAPGAPGAQGPAGPAGAKGETGPAGKDGANGTNGMEGKTGANGTSATTESFTGNAHGCSEGGVIVKSASPETVVCNGKEGKTGKNGTNGTTGFTEYLPEEKSERGTWSVERVVTKLEREEELPEQLTTAISFPIPLEAALGETQVHYIGLGEGEGQSGQVATAITEGKCKGSNQKPEAAPGNLCVFESQAGYRLETNETYHIESLLDLFSLIDNPEAKQSSGLPSRGEGVEGAGRSGAVLEAEFPLGLLQSANAKGKPEGGWVAANGVWVVKAP